MLRIFILVGVVAGGFATIPMIYERNPDAFEALARRIMSGADTPPRQPSAEISRTAAPREPAQPLGRKVRIEAGQGGHYTAEFELNGRRVPALIDTGATFVAINESTARRIGINVAAGDFRYDVNTANGKARAAAAMIDRLEIGRITVSDVRALVLEDEALAHTLVGMSFLNRLSRFEVKRGALLLEQ